MDSTLKLNPLEQTWMEGIQVHFIVSRDAINNMKQIWIDIVKQYLPREYILNFFLKEHILKMFELRDMVLIYIIYSCIMS